MSLAEYQTLLIHAIERKVITPEEAAMLLDRFQRGDFAEEDLPLSVDNVQRVDRNDESLLALLLLLLKQSSSQGAKVRLRNTNRRNDVASLTAIAGDIESIQTFQQSFSDTVQRSILRQWMGGARQANWPTTIDDMITEQLAYAERFAADIHFRQQVNRPLTLGEIVIRAAMYAGAAWAASYMGNEYGDDRYGWVYEYQPIDDGKTCRRCHEAKGYYLSGQGPYPGQICLGGWRCRCRRVAVYNPDIYARLRG